MALTFLRGIVIFFISLTASKNMHNAMVMRIARAPILFFDSHPVGRIQTRFSKDTSTLDLLIPPITVFASFGLFRTVTVFMIICVI
jgi:ABC-type multidrug transport system fused ATPase/permease subunit